MIALLVLSYVGFVSLGLPDSLLGAAWPAIRAELGLPLDAAGAAVLVATAGVVLSSVTSGRLLARVGTGTVLAASALLAGLALVGYAVAPSWGAMLAAAALAGCSGGAVDAALNGFVARHFSARHMSFLHASWGIGATAGPLTLAAALRQGASWRTAYGLVAAVELALALVFLLTLPRWRAAARAAAAGEGAGGGGAAGAPPGPLRATPAMRASVLLFLVYGGLEAAAGLWGASLLVATKGATAPVAGAVMSLYWGALTVGRILAGALGGRGGAGERGGDRTVMRASVAALGAAAVLCVPGLPLAGAAGALAGLGLALAPIYPAAMHETPRRFGAAAAVHLVGYQVAAASLGIALLPWLVGAIARRTSLHEVPPLLAGLALLMVAAARGRAAAPGPS